MGVREVTLLGQNVNSYATEDDRVPIYPNQDGSLPTDSEAALAHYRLREGFASKVPPARGSLRFAGLLARLAEAHPEMRFRFTSPHPKDFPDELLGVIAAHPNVCESLHIPAQSGSSAVLEAMRRGYDRRAYVELVSRVRELLPGAALSSDFISGFCGETEDDHHDTLSLLREVRFERAFMFAYSLREKTHAHRALVDDVPEAIKQRRLREVIDTFTPLSRARNDAEVGRTHLVLVEGLSKKSDADWAGRTDTGKKVVLPRRAVSRAIGQAGEVELSMGDYVAVRVTDSLSANTLRGEPLARASIGQFEESRRRGHAAL
jgi:MiaB/RimO family radical SAM methylthiotransferase